MTSYECDRCGCTMGEQADTCWPCAIQEAEYKLDGYKSIIDSRNAALGQLESQRQVLRVQVEACEWYLAQTCRSVGLSADEVTWVAAAGFHPIMGCGTTRVDAITNLWKAVHSGRG